MARTRGQEKTVAYRLGSPYVEKLEEKAQQAGMSPHQFARLALVMHFEETAVHRCADEVADLKSGLERLGGIVSRALSGMV
jgi:uncharacterized protein YbaP (TraB family)